MSDDKATLSASRTPRTDEAERLRNPLALPALCRQLERELDEANAKIATAITLHEMREEEIAARSSTGTIDAVEVALAITRDVAELPDRTSPDDWPEAMLVTDKELRRIVHDRLMEALGSARSARRFNTEDAAALVYLLESTAPDGQWADQAVHSFVRALLKIDASTDRRTENG